LRREQKGHCSAERKKATDTLIARIVYKLYALTPEEIEIVEGTDRV